MVGKMAERSESMPVSCAACFYFFLIVGGSSRGLIDLKMSWAGGLFCPILLFTPLQSYWWKRHTINSILSAYIPTQYNELTLRVQRTNATCCKIQKKTHIKYRYACSTVDFVNWVSFPWCVISAISDGSDHSHLHCWSDDFISSPKLQQPEGSPDAEASPMYRLWLVYAAHSK